MKKLIISFVILATVGCATPGYQKAGADGLHRTGYTETKITETMYRVSYLDSQSDKAYQHFLRRAAELTVANNYKYFSTRDVGELKEQKLRINSMSESMNLPKYEATVEFQKEKIQGSFDAQEIIANQVQDKK